MALEEIAVPDTASVYELSSRGALVRYLRSRFHSRLYVSEFFEDVDRGETRKGIPCQDVQKLTIRDSEFDLVTSTEVFEHVPDDLSGFREILRILRPTGYFVFTVPLAARGETLERAILRGDGTLEFLQVPEYHSDRLRGRGAVLAFRTYGTDITARLRSVGFEARIRWFDSVPHRIRNQPVILAKKPQLPG